MVVRVSLELSRQSIHPKWSFQSFNGSETALPLPTPVASRCAWHLSNSFLYLQLPSGHIHPSHSSCGWFFQSSSVLSDKGRVRRNLPEKQLLLSVSLPIECLHLHNKTRFKPIKVWDAYKWSESVIIQTCSLDHASELLSSLPIHFLVFVYISGPFVFAFTFSLCRDLMASTLAWLLATRSAHLAVKPKPFVVIKVKISWPVYAVEICSFYLKLF